jgi:hypothetical protein
MAGIALSPAMQAIDNIHESGINHRQLMSEVMGEIGGQKALAQIIREEIHMGRGLHPDGTPPHPDDPNNYPRKPQLVQKYVALLMHHVRSDSEMQMEFSSMSDSEMFSLGRAVLIDAFLNDESFRRSIFKTISKDDDVLADMRLYSGAVEGITVEQ